MWQQHNSHSLRSSRYSLFSAPLSLVHLPIWHQRRRIFWQKCNFWKSAVPMQAGKYLIWFEVQRRTGQMSAFSSLCIAVPALSFLGLRLLSSLTLPNTVRWRVWSPRNGRLSWCSLGPTVELLQSPGLFSTCQNYCVFIIFIDFGTSVNSGLLSASAMLSTSGIEQWESRRWSSSRGSAPKLLGSILDSSSRGSDAKWLDSISSSCNTRSSSVHMVEANAMSHQAGTSIDQRLITFPKVHQTHCLGIEGFQSLHGGKERKLLALWMSNSSCCKMMSLL